MGVWSPTDPQFRARCPRPRGPEDQPPQGAASPAQSPGPPPPPSQPSPAWALVASRAAVSLLQSGLFTASAREAHRSGAEVTSAACKCQELRTPCFSCPRLPQPGPSQEGAQRLGHLPHRPRPRGLWATSDQRGPTPGPCLKLPAARAPALGARGWGLILGPPGALSWFCAQWACATLPCATQCCPALC